MKNKKGFTLIELLAVIVILAIIALITVPILLNVIDKSKKGALQDSAYGIIEAGELFYAQNLTKELDSEGTRYDFEVKNGKFVYTKDNAKSLAFKGTIPKTGTLQINSNGQTAVAICTNDYCACKSISELKVKVKDTNCNIDPVTGEIGTTELIGKTDSTPAGTIISFGGQNTPEGYLICDGSEVSRTEYADLYSAIGDLYGAGDGSTTFNVPDLRGDFLRGTGTATRNTGSGANVGVHQDGTAIPMLKSYFTSNDGWIGITRGESENATNFVKFADLYNGAESMVVYSQSGGHYIGGGTQPVSYTTRPTNTSVLYCIKY